MTEGEDNLLRALREQCAVLQCQLAVRDLRKWVVEMAVKANAPADHVVRLASDLLVFVESGEAPAPLKGVDRL